MPSLTGLGMESTRALASLSPRPVIALTSLITAIFLSPDEVKITSNSVFSSALASSVASPLGPAFIIATGAAAETPNFSSSSFTKSERSSTDMLDINSITSFFVISAIFSSRLFSISFEMLIIISIYYVAFFCSFMAFNTFTTFNIIPFKDLTNAVVTPFIVERTLERRTSLEGSSDNTLTESKSIIFPFITPIFISNFLFSLANLERTFAGATGSSKLKAIAVEPLKCSLISTASVSSDALVSKVFFITIYSTLASRSLRLRTFIDTTSNPL
mmetsp:Transcript_8473/g.4597  ORF Transcript_8473/g.4597 Transcript_8473/m.4597 type:complete len:273 (+) Transcript_8473:5182-6000(+)